MPDRVIPDEPDRIIRDRECGVITGLSRTTRWRLEKAGKFPRRRKISPGAIGWLLSEIMERHRQIAESNDAPQQPEAAVKDRKERAAEPALAE